MNGQEIRDRLVKVGDVVKAKGWESARIDVYVSYLAIFDREPSPLDPMIYCSPSISVSTRDRYGAPTSHQLVKNGHECSTIEEALDKLDETARDMPTRSDEEARIEAARSKLSADEKRLLGVR